LLIQNWGRAARNNDGTVIFYAEDMTPSMRRAIEETNRRRDLQRRYNQAHGITPASIKKDITDILGSIYEADYVTIPSLAEPEEEHISLDRLPRLIRSLKKEMHAAAKRLDFEEAARLRDRIYHFERMELERRSLPPS
jgi:excinuclease ABC subunit B